MAVPKQVRASADEARAFMARAADPAPEEDVDDTVESDPPMDKDETKESRPERIDPEDWKARYAALRNKQDSRLTEAQATIQTLQSENEDLTRRIADMQPPQETRPTIDDDDRELMGDTTASHIEKLNERLDKQAADAQAEAKAKSDREVQALIQEVDALVPNWRELNRDRAFLDWIKGQDEEVGETRQAIIDQATLNRQPTVIAYVYNSFIEQGTARQSESGHEPSPDPESLPTGDVPEVEEEWITGDELAKVTNAMALARRQNRMTGPAWDKLVARRKVIDAAIAEHRVIA